MPPGSGSAWTDADPDLDPGGKKVWTNRIVLYININLLMSLLIYYTPDTGQDRQPDSGQGSLPKLS